MSRAETESWRKPAKRRPGVIGHVGTPTTTVRKGNDHGNKDRSKPPTARASINKQPRAQRPKVDWQAQIDRAHQGDKRAADDVSFEAVHRLIVEKRLPRPIARQIAIALLSGTNIFVGGKSHRKSPGRKPTASAITRAQAAIILARLEERGFKSYGSGTKKSRFYLLALMEGYEDNTDEAFHREDALRKQHNRLRRRGGSALPALAFGQLASPDK